MNQPNISNPIKLLTAISFTGLSRKRPEKLRKLKKIQTKAISILDHIKWPSLKDCLSQVTLLICYFQIKVLIPFSQVRSVTHTRKSHQWLLCSKLVLILALSVATGTVLEELAPPCWPTPTTNEDEPLQQQLQRLKIDHLISILNNKLIGRDSVHWTQFFFFDCFFSQ